MPSTLLPSFPSRPEAIHTTALHPGFRGDANRVLRVELTLLRNQEKRFLCLPLKLFFSAFFVWDVDIDRRYLDRIGNVDFLHTDVDVRPAHIDVR